MTWGCTPFLWPPCPPLGPSLAPRQGTRVSPLLPLGEAEAAQQASPTTEEQGAVQRQWAARTGPPLPPDDNPHGPSAGHPPEGGPEATTPGQEVTKDAPSTTMAEEMPALVAQPQSHCLASTLT